MAGADLGHFADQFGAQVRIVALHGVFECVQDAILGLFQLGDVGRFFITGQRRPGIGVYLANLAGERAAAGGCFLVGGNAFLVR